MGTVQARRGRYVWARLGATNSTTLPIPGQPQSSAWQFIFTPAFGYRFLDGEKAEAVIETG